MANNNVIELVFRVVDQGARAAVNGLRNALNGIGGVAANAGNATKDAASKTGEAVKRATNDAVAATKDAAAKTGEAVEKTAEKAGKAAESMGSKFAKVAAAIGAMAFMRSSLFEFAGFDDAMLKVQALSKATGDEFEALKTKAQELGASTKFTAAEAAAGMSQLAAAGYDTSNILYAIGPSMYAAAAGGSDLAETADQLTNIMGAFGLEADQAERVADVLTEGFTGAATTLSQLSFAMKPAGAVAHSLNYSLEETVAVLQTLANAGYKGEMAGTALKGALAQLLKPSNEATEILKKYGIQLKDSEGRFRKFSEIIRELGNAGVDTAEMFALFGTEAGPAMQALVSQGANAIEDYERKLKSAGGRAKEVSDKMESGIGGALRRLDAAFSQLKNSFGEAIAPAVSKIADALGALAGWFAKMPAWAKQALAVGTALAAFAGSFGVIAFAARTVASGFGAVFGAMSSLFAPLASLTADTVTYTKAVGLLGGKVEQLKFVLRSLSSVAAAAFVGWEIGNFLNQFDVVRQAGVALASGLEKAFLRVKLAWAFWTGGDVAAIERELEQVDKIYGEMFADIERGVDEYRQKQKQAAAEQKKEHKEVTDSAKKNNDEQVADAEITAKELAKTYKSYVEEVKRLQEQITDRQKSLQAELRSMKRGGMNDADAWVDQRNEAREYVKYAKQAADEARRAFAAGDTITAAQRWKEAVQYADDARNAYKALNHEVKSGDQVIISAQTALQGSMRGVREAGELAIEFLKEQEKAAAETTKEMERTTDLATLTSEMDAAEKKWVEGWRKMRGEVEDTAKVMQEYWKNAAGFWTNTDDAFSAGWSKKSADEFVGNWNDGYAKFERRGKDAADAVKRAIDKAAEDRQTTIRIRTLETRRWGGLIGEAVRYAVGGKLPGYGGGDKVSALLEAGEYVIRKEAVTHFGSGFFDALNSLRMPNLSALLPQMPQPAVAAPMGHMVLELKLPGGDSVTATVSREDAETLARHNRRVSNLRFRK